MKKSLGSLIAVNRRALLMLGVMLSLAVFGIATWRTSAWSMSGSSAQPAEKGGDPEAVRFLEEQINNGNFELMSSAKQLQLQLQAGMKYEDGVLKPGLPNDVRPYKQLFDTKRIEALASSEGIMAALANPLVNNPAADATARERIRQHRARGAARVRSPACHAGAGAPLRSVGAVAFAASAVFLLSRLFIR